MIHISIIFLNDHRHYYRGGNNLASAFLIYIMISSEDEERASFCVFTMTLRWTNGRVTVALHHATDQSIELQRQCHDHDNI